MSDRRLSEADRQLLQRALELVSSGAAGDAEAESATAPGAEGRRMSSSDQETQMEGSGQGNGSNPSSRRQRTTTSRRTAGRAAVNLSKCRLRVLIVPFVV